MKRSEAQKALDDAYNQLRTEHNLPECLLGDFLHDRGQPGLVVASTDFTDTVAITADEVCATPSLQATIELVRIKLLDALESTRDLLDENIKKLGGN